MVSFVHFTSHQLPYKNFDTSQLWLVALHLDAHSLLHVLREKDYRVFSNHFDNRGLLRQIPKQFGTFIWLPSFLRRSKLFHYPGFKSREEVRRTTGIGQTSFYCWCSCRLMISCWQLMEMLWTCSTQSFLFAKIPNNKERVFVSVASGWERVRSAIG